jgi:hypothetical protein
MSSKKMSMLRSKLTASKPVIKSTTKSIIRTQKNNKNKKHEEIDSDVEIEIHDSKKDDSNELSESMSESEQEVEDTINIKSIKNSEEELDEILLVSKKSNTDDEQDDNDIEVEQDKSVDMEEQILGSEENNVSDDNQLDETEEKTTKKNSKRKTSTNIRKTMKARIKEDDIIKKARSKKTTTKTGIKKGPGRPRKTPKKEPIPRKGISKHPSLSDSFIEVVYDQPVIFKKIFQFFKALAAPQIQMIFRPRDIIMYAEDHHQKSKIRIKIDASKINHYYCKDVLDIGISQKEMELILNKVDKEYSAILLLSSVGSKHRTIDLTLENDIQIDELHTIELINPTNKMENEDEFIDENYAINFELPSKYFRKTINDIKTMSTELSITQENSISPLVFEYLTPNKKIQSKHTVKNSNKIKLKSYLEDGNSFRIDVHIEHIKPISASQIADEVTILVDEDKALMTKAFIDNETIEIKTLTEIIDERPEDDE